MVCVREGENAIVELAKRMFIKKELEGVPNLWFKKNGKVIKCKNRDLLDVNLLSVPRFDIFAPERMFRAMAGKNLQDAAN
jgi:hypothetical protein